MRGFDDTLSRDNAKETREMWGRFFRGGRNVMYNQNANLSYVLPTSKIPALDWTKVQATYSATYTWTTASAAGANVREQHSEYTKPVGDGRSGFHAVV